MSENLTLFDYSELDRDTREFLQERAERIHNLARMTAQAIVQIGQYLTEVKDRVGHGHFVRWIEHEFAWSRMTANKLMQVYEFLKCKEYLQTEKLGTLDVDVSALYLIAAPKTAEPVRNEVIRRAEAGEPVTHEAARAVVQQFRKTGELPDVNISLPELIREERARRNNGHIAPAPAKPTPAEKQEQREIQERMKVSQIRVNAFMEIIEAIEVLTEPKLTIAEIAGDMHRFHPPDHDWVEDTRKARATLNALLKEL